MSGSVKPSSALLQAHDPEPFKVINRAGRTPLLLICDHASRGVPKALGNLGLDADVFERHIAYDIGTENIALGLSDLIDAPLVLGGFSRLVIDLNRPLEHPDSMVEYIDSTRIPGNIGLTKMARLQRVKELFDPYHEAIKQEITRLSASGMPPIILSVHSFSPNYGMHPRPWDIGVLWNRDPRIATPLIDILKTFNLKVGDNQPYSGKELAYTINKHGGARGLANCVIEINQGQLSDDGGIKNWISTMNEVLRILLRDKGLNKIEHF